MSTPDRVKINALEIENVKRIRAVALEPTPSGITIIGGANNQGKTSVLDAITWALGGDRHRPSDAAREGSVLPPKIRVTLSNGLVAERSGKNSALRVIDPEGRRGGQQLLNEFVAELALDLPKFMAQNDREKADTLLQIIGVGPQLQELDRQAQQLYYQRRAIGQEADRKKKYAEELPQYPDAPMEPVSASELIYRQQDILARNGENQRKRAQAAELERQKATLGWQLEQLRAKYDTVCHDYDIALRSAQELVDESTTELERDIADIDALNQKIRANQEYERAIQEAAQCVGQYDDLTVQLEAVRQQRMDLLQHADLPLEGLSVEDGALIYQGRRWDCLSGSDQLRVATAIVRALNPRCGFVLLDKLEQMDPVTLREFSAWLEQQGLQAIATRVSTGDECDILIYDGYVVESSEQQYPTTNANGSWKAGVF